MTNENEIELKKETLENIGILSNVEYAGFWRRFAAHAIDYVLVFTATLIIAFIFGIGMIEGGEVEAGVGGFIIGLLTPWLYYATMESSPKQATLGKMALGIIVVDTEGNKISFARATGRYWAKIISALILIGFVMVGFTARKQGLHDIIASCFVIVKN